MNWITEEAQAFKTLRETFGVTDEEIQAALDVEEPRTERDLWIKQGFTAIVSAVTQQRAQQARVLGAPYEGIPPTGWRPNFRAWTVEIAAKDFDTTAKQVEASVSSRMVEVIQQALKGRFASDRRWSPSRAPIFYYCVGNDDTGEGGFASREGVERVLKLEEEGLDPEDLTKAREFLALDPPAPPGSFVIVGERLDLGDDEVHIGTHVDVVRVDDEEWKDQ